MTLGFDQSNWRARHPVRDRKSQTVWNEMRARSTPKGRGKKLEPAPGFTTPELHKATKVSARYIRSFVRACHAAGYLETNRSKWRGTSPHDPARYVVTAAYLKVDQAPQLAGGSGGGGGKLGLGWKPRQADMFPEGKARK